MVTRKRGSGWEYDMRLLGKRWRKARFRTKAEAAKAENRKREELLSGKVLKTFREAYDEYKIELERRSRAATTVEDYDTFMTKTLGPAIGHLYLSEVTTSVVVKLKQSMPKTWGPKSINQRLILLRAVMNFAYAMEWIPYPPKIPMEAVPKKRIEWHQTDERDKFLQGVFAHQPQWYFFFYLTTMYGLRRGEVYPMEHTQFDFDRGLLLIDKAVVRGTKTRPAIVRQSRKGGDTVEHTLRDDILEAYKWHCANGYAGKTLVFCPTDEIPKFLDSHVAPMNIVFAKTGMKRITHHKLGRHSVGSQADAIGATHKTIQGLLGHRSPRSTDQYVHGSKAAQKTVLDALRPVRAPHEPTPPEEMN